MTTDFVALCKRTYKRAFYHAYTKFLLDEPHIVFTSTFVAVKFNRCFYYDVTSSSFNNLIIEDNRPFETKLVVSIDRELLPSLTERAKEIRSFIADDKERNLIELFETTWYDENKFVTERIELSRYQFIRYHARHTYEAYVEYLVDRAWHKFCTLNNGNDFDKIVASLAERYDPTFQASRYISSDQLKPLLDIITVTCTNKDEIIERITESGLLDSMN